MAIYILKRFLFKINKIINYLKKTGTSRCNAMLITKSESISFCEIIKFQKISTFIYHY